MIRKTWFVCLTILALQLLLSLGAQAQKVSYKARVAMFKVDGTNLSAICGHIAQYEDGSYWVYLDYADTYGNSITIRSADSIVITPTKLRLSAPILFNGVEAWAEISLKKTGWRTTAWDFDITSAQEAARDSWWFQYQDDCTYGSLLMLMP